MKNIEEKIDSLFEDYKNKKVYKDFISIKNQIKNDKDIMDIIEEIKRLQKIAVNSKDTLLEEKIKDLYIRLESYPVYQSYLINKEEIESEMFEIKEIFEKYFYDILNLK